MNQDLFALIQKHKNKGIVLDTNVAMLYIVGSSHPQSIVRNKRTSMYDVNDFDRLSKFVDSFKTKIVTPHILTEISNLLSKDAEIRKVFTGFIKISDETFLASKKLVNDPSFSRLGLTDTAILEAAANDLLVVTDDVQLGFTLMSQGADVVSLSQIRQV